MRKRRHVIGYLFGLALTLAGLTSPATAQSTAPMRNGKIAFVADGRFTGGIWVMNSDGSGRTQLTVTQEAGQSPAWSPDGSQMAYVVLQAGVPTFEIWLMNADGSNKRRLTGGAWWPKPAWSPDGRRIAFTGDPRPTGVASLYVMDADGSNQRIIGEGWSPSWSPDGSKLVVTDLHQMYILNADGTGRTPLANPGTDYDSQPDWSPDGSRIAFTRSVNCDGDGCESTAIWTVNGDGTNLTKVCNIWGAYGHNWSPDGTKIVFASSGSRSLDLFLMNADGSGITNITNSAEPSESMPSWQPVAIAPPPIDDPQVFVRQHYLDFLNRQPDADGLAFWTSEITLCGTNQQCIEAKRINVSAAFFYSIEFQQTGYLVYRTYKASYGNLPNAPVPIKLNEFLPDTQQIGQGVIVNQAGWQQLLENNTLNFFAEFVQRSRFSSAFPTSLTPEQFVDQLFVNAGVTPSVDDRADAIHEFGGATTTADVFARARALRRVAENSTLAQQEFNRAFVLMQYFGYLRRNPNDLPDTNFDGYNFWLTKLNQFNGDFRTAEMVKAFLVSTEYRQRFGL